MSPVADQPDPDAIATAVSACPSVSGLSGGFAGEVATYLPGRRVSGVRVNPGSVEIHVVARYGSPIGEIDSEVRAAVQAAAPVFGGDPLQVDVIIADVEDPFAVPEEEEKEPLALEAGPSAEAAALPPAPPTSPGLSASGTGTPGTGTPAVGNPATSPSPSPIAAPPVTSAGASGVTRVAPPSESPLTSPPPTSATPPVPPVPPTPPAPTVIP